MAPQTAILAKLYEAYFRDRSPVNMHSLPDELNIDETAFWNIVDYMSDKGLIYAWAAGGNYIIKALGIIRAEEQGIISDELVNQNQRTRTVILDHLAAIRKAKGSYADAYVQSMTTELAIDGNVLVNNLQVLENLGYIESIASGSYKITHEGMDAVAEWKQRTGLADEFKGITLLKPQPRGRAFQGLLARVIEKNGWLQEEGTRTPHEEIDVIVYKEREYYLVECKWEKSPIEAPVIREVFGKVSNRIGVQGILASMSGFTEGAKKQAEEYANSRLILFFGPEDINSLIYGQTTFDVQLNEKYNQLITHRKIIYR